MKPTESSVAAYLMIGSRIRVLKEKAYRGVGAPPGGFPGYKDFSEGVEGTLVDIILRTDGSVFEYHIEIEGWRAVVMDEDDFEFIR